MKVCPKCGYEDAPYWKNCSHGLDWQTQFCHFHELEFADPDLAKKILLEKDYDDGLYWYHLTTTGTMNVYRNLSRYVKYSGGKWEQRPGAERIHKIVLGKQVPLF